MAYIEPRYCLICESPESLCICDMDADDYEDKVAEKLLELFHEGKLQRKD